MLSPTALGKVNYTIELRGAMGSFVCTRGYRVKRHDQENPANHDWRRTCRGMADVTVFGHLDTSTDFTDQDGGSDAQNLNCNTCSLGFKGSEDLGNGLKAIVKLDFQFDMTEGNDARTSTSKGASATMGNAMSFFRLWAG